MKRLHIQGEPIQEPDPETGFSQVRAFFFQSGVAIALIDQDQEFGLKKRLCFDGKKGDVYGAGNPESSERLFPPDVDKDDLPFFA